VPEKFDWNTYNATVSGRGMGFKTILDFESTPEFISYWKAFVEALGLLFTTKHFDVNL